MSGASMAAGPRPNRGTHGKGDQEGKAPTRESGESGALGGVMGSLRVVELQLVAFIIVFSASGLVPLQDLVFPVVLSAYALLLSALVFPSYGSSRPPDVFRGNRFFQIYVVVGTATGLFLPLAYVLGGFARGDQKAVRDATPHLFLLSFQILSENVITSLGIFSTPVRSLLPILYTTRRIFALMDWTVDTWTSTPRSHRPSDTPRGGGLVLPEDTWLWFGRALAITNTVYFSVNLFCFLIPMFLPRAFEQYFNDRAVYLSQHQDKHGPGATDHNKQQQSNEETNKVIQPIPYQGDPGAPKKKSQ